MGRGVEAVRAESAGLAELAALSHPGPQVRGTRGTRLGACEVTFGGEGGRLKTGLFMRHCTEMQYIGGVGGVSASRVVTFGQGGSFHLSVFRWPGGFPTRGLLTTASILPRSPNARDRSLRSRTGSGLPATTPVETTQDGWRDQSGAALIYSVFRTSLS